MHASIDSEGKSVRDSSLTIELDLGNTFTVSFGPLMAWFWCSEVEKSSITALRVVGSEVRCSHGRDCEKTRCEIWWQSENHQQQNLSQGNQDVASMMIRWVSRSNSFSLLSHFHYLPCALRKCESQVGIWSFTDKSSHGFDACVIVTINIYNICMSTVRSTVIVYRIW